MRAGRLAWLESTSMAKSPEVRLNMTVSSSGKWDQTGLERLMEDCSIAKLIYESDQFLDCSFEILL